MGFLPRSGPRRRGHLGISVGSFDLGTNPRALQSGVTSLSPCQVSWPSGRAKAAVINPATGSTHDAPVSAKMISLARVERDSSTLIVVAAAPSGIRFSLRAVPGFFWAAASTGMMISKSTRMTMISGRDRGLPLGLPWEGPRAGPKPVGFSGSGYVVSPHHRRVPQPKRSKDWGTLTPVHGVMRTGCSHSQTMP